MDDSTSEWLTYEQAAERLHVSPAAARAGHAWRLAAAAGK